MRCEFLGGIASRAAFDEGRSAERCIPWLETTSFVTT